MRDGYFVIDSDGHVHETVDGGTKLRSFMDPKFRTRPFGGDWNDRSVGGKYGRRHGDPAVQVQDMDEEGIDIAVLYTTALLGAWGLRDRDYTIALHRAYNSWLADFCSHNPDRLKGV